MAFGHPITRGPASSLEYDNQQCGTGGMRDRIPCGKHTNTTARCDQIPMPIRACQSLDMPVELFWMNNSSLGGCRGQSWGYDCYLRSSGQIFWVNRRRRWGREDHGSSKSRTRHFRFAGNGRCRIDDYSWCCNGGSHCDGDNSCWSPAMPGMGRWDGWGCRHSRCNWAFSNRSYLKNMCYIQKWGWCIKVQTSLSCAWGIIPGQWEVWHCTHQKMHQRIAREKGTNSLSTTTVSWLNAATNSNKEGILSAALVVSVIVLSTCMVS